ncbi:hypothetical protein [Jannaschia formosa]|uniref:hypothetical protein n=1 Tax=Jannaschia formosa TaxID=2259592 RepID=UPI00142FE338|nr:hypothetical protein [Jannaschia formosa]
MEIVQGEQLVDLLDLLKRWSSGLRSIISAEECIPFGEPPGLYAEQEMEQLF